MSDLANRVSLLEKQVKTLTEAREEDRKLYLDLIDRCTSVIGQTNERLDKHFNDQQELADRLNLAEGMVDIFKKDISDINRKLFEEELNGCEAS